MTTIVGTSAVAVATGVATIPAAIPAGLAGDTVKLCCFSNNTAADYSATGYGSDHLQSAIGCELLTTTDATTGGGTVNVTRTSTTAGCIVVAVRLRDDDHVAEAEFASASGDVTAPDVIADAANSLLISVAVRLVSLAGQTWTVPSGMAQVAQADTTGSIFRWAVASQTVGAGATGTKFWDQSGSGAVRALNFVVTPDVIPPKQGSASGGYAFAGSATGQRKSAGTAAGGYAFAGSAAGEAPRQGSAQGGYNFAGVAIGHEPGAPSIGFTEGGYDFSGSAVGEAVRQGSAEGSYGYEGSAAGVAPGGGNPYRFCTGCRPRRRRRR